MSFALMSPGEVSKTHPAGFPGDAPVVNASNFLNEQDFIIILLLLRRRVFYPKQRTGLQ
jgi:hypothetical protein